MGDAVNTSEPPPPPRGEIYTPPSDALDVPFRETAPIDPAHDPVVHGTIVEPGALRVFGNPVAYVLRRFAASTIDLVLGSFVVTWLLYGIIAVNPLTGLPTNTEGGFDSTFAMGIGAALLYVFLAEAIFGTTLGKLALSLHVYSSKGNFVGLARSFIRSLLRPIDLLVVGALLALAPGHRRLGDLFGGTVVAQSPLRGVAPVIGWIGIVAVAALPFIFDGGLRFFIVLAAFAQFVPHLISGAIAGLGGLLASPHA